MADSEMNPARQWIASQIGSREHYALPRALHSRGVLDRFYTDVWMRHGRSLLGKMPGGFRSLAGRYHPALPADHVTSFNAGGIARIVEARRCQSIEETYQHYLTTGQWFSRRITRDLERRTIDPQRHAALLFTTSALDAMRHLRDRGVPCVANQIDPGRVEEQIVMDECAKWPGWQKLPGRIPDAYYDRLAAEWQTADVVMVNSDWSKEALIQQGVPAGKLRVVPLVYEPAEITAPRKPNPSQPLRVLWLGQVILRKGIAYLFEAAKLLAAEKIEFTVVGPIGISQKGLDAAPPNVRIVGPVARSQTAEYYRNADLFVLPTLSDGFAITQLEAMSYDLPVIATPRCGKVVTPGEDGLIVPPADAAALAEAIGSLSRDRERLAAFSTAAVAKAGRFTLAGYAAEIERTLQVADK